MDSCCCMGDGGDCDEEIIDYLEIEDIAQLPGRCDECGAEILPGQKFRWAGWAFAGSYRSGMSWDICISCNICNLIFDSLCDCGEGRLWFCLWEHLSECIGIGSPDEIPEWTAEDEEYEADRIEYYGRSHPSLDRNEKAAG